MNTHKIILTGFMGSGKTTVAQALATVCGMPLYDMDTEILKRSRVSDMGELFAAQGELYFRELEISLAREWAHLQEAIISTGGGVVQNKIILDYFRRMQSIVVYLQLDFETLRKRVESDTSTVRPLFTNKKNAKQLFDLRAPLYQAYADITIDTNGQSPEQIAKSISQFIQLHT